MRPSLWSANRLVRSVRRSRLLACRLRSGCSPVTKTAFSSPSPQSTSPKAEVELIVRTAQQSVDAGRSVNCCDAALAGAEARDPARGGDPQREREGLGGVHVVGRSAAPPCAYGNENTPYCVVRDPRYGDLLTTAEAVRSPTVRS